MKNSEVLDGLLELGQTRVTVDDDHPGVLLQPALEGAGLGGGRGVEALEMFDLATQLVQSIGQLPEPVEFPPSCLQLLTRDGLGAQFLLSLCNRIQLPTQLIEFLGAAPPSASFIRGHTVTLGVDHTASGNPMRFEVGDVTVQPDEVWRQKMAIGDRRLVTACTWPLLIGYGYAGTRERAVTSHGITPAGA